MIRQLLTSQPNRQQIALIRDETEYSYGDLIQKASGLQTLLPRGQAMRIALFLPDGADYIAAFWGVISSGLTVFPLNIMLTKHEIISLLKQVSVAAVVTQTAFRNLFEGLSDNEVPTWNMIYMDEVKEAAGARIVNTAAHRTMVLLNTSGTSSTSRIVELTEQNMESSVAGFLKKIDFNEREAKATRMILAVPFSSVYGIMVLTASLKCAFPIVLLNHEFTLHSFYQTVEKHKVTHYEGSGTVITLMDRMAGRAVPYDSSSLQYMGFGGSKVSGASIEKVRNLHPDIEFSQGYGMTEAAPMIAKHPRRDSRKRPECHAGVLSE